MTYFDSDEFKKLEEQDRQFLAKGKIDFETKISTIVDKIEKSKKILSMSDSELESYLKEQRKQTMQRLRNSLGDDYADIYDDPYDDMEDVKQMPQRTTERESELFMEEHMDFPIEETRNDTLRELDWAAKELTDLIEVISNKDRIEALANEIKTWKNPETWFSGRYPWKDVALSMLKHPESITFDYKHCPDCGQARVKIYFSSPQTTWATNCGVGGPMVICPHCRKQVDFKVHVIN